MSGLNDLFYKISSGTKNVQIHFNDLEDYVVEQIEKSTAVIGCANWLKSEKIINALSGLKDGTSIIIDKRTVQDSKKEYRDAFNSLQPLKFKIMSLEEQYAFGSHYELENMPAHTLNTDAVRVFGSTYKRYNNHYLMHHKFMIFCTLSKDGTIQPSSVLTGSYNFTENGTHCRENLIHLTGDEYTSAYYGEWRGCFLLSEKINKFSKDIRPEYLKHKDRKSIIKAITKEYSKIEDCSDPYFGI